ncbi:hypothetical protein [Paenibacillus popilliae]|uniref:Uncharacterized protein n=1 Tax=Paenibacillus popilliae ATCC 14706 TaxID=1212764 RepID=M9M3Y3_PAEPP|nr:hypothetical protein [Paenibacillus popilliae]GAC41978.1 hypothetical protein PPOP_1335 [Paenibacillus popilliae ATCC 14706]
MEQILQQILNKLDKLEAGQQKLEAEITSIKKDTELIPLIQQAVSEVNNEVAATSETIQRMDESLKAHEVTLDLLSRRSIDQEAALRKII